MFKNLVMQALETIRIRFLQKKKLKFHACVPLKFIGEQMDNSSMRQISV
jgi:hypothetical protein